MARRQHAARARVAWLVASAALSFATPLVAQRRAEPRRAEPRQQNAAASTRIRAELASVLLQSKRYAEAAREYRALLEREPSNFDYRLGLARALAWGDQPREAERELRVLQARKPPRVVVDTLLRLVREAIRPTALEAAGWVRERPDYPPYRLAFARALAGERDGRLAAVQYDSLLPYAGVGRIPAVPVLRREQAQAHLDAGNFADGANALRSVLRTSPTDTALRHELAVVLASGPREWQSEARAHYDTLLAGSPNAVVFAERARLRLDADDKAGAESDLRASIALAPTAAAHLMLGDLFRGRREYLAASLMYHAALDRVDAEDGDPAMVLAAIARVAREERPVVLAPQIGDAGGWRMSTDGAGDNLGVHYAASTFRVTVPLGENTNVSVAALHQYLGERSALRRLDLNAMGGEASAATGGGYGPVFGRLSVSGGALRSPDSRTIALRSATGALWVNAWELALAGSTGPAYPSLLTTTALRLLDGEDDVITEKNASATLGGPVGRADVAVTAQQSRLSDGNRRTTAHGVLRFAIAPGVYAMYDVSHVTFEKRSTRYWDPLEYTAHGAGLEIASRAAEGLAVAVSALPGKAWGTELPYLPAPRGTRPVRAQSVVNRSAFQLGASAEIGWRDPMWEWTTALSYGRGRAGDYQRLGATFAFRAYR